MEKLHKERRLMTQLLNSISKIPLAFGGAAISGEGGGYGFGDITEAKSIELLHQSFDLGIRIFDTAPIYGFGLSEIRMGKAFRQMRDKVFLVSKSGVSWGDNKRVNMTNDPLVTLKMMEQSLRDLQSDYIDLYMIHWPDPRVDIRRPLEVLSKARDQGKIKHIGLCNTNIEELNKAFEIARIEVVQSEFNLFQNNAKDDLFPYLREQDISFMSWGTLDKGILTGRVDESRKFETSDCRSWAPWWKNADNKSKFDAMKKIWPLLDSHKHNGLELALAHNLNYPDLSVALCGVKNQDQLLSLFKALENLPSSDLLTEVQELAFSTKK